MLNTSDKHKNIPKLCFEYCSLLDVIMKTLTELCIMIIYHKKNSINIFKTFVYPEIPLTLCMLFFSAHS